MKPVIADQRSIGEAVLNRTSGKQNWLGPV
jgi:hypothetical protein